MMSEQRFTIACGGMTAEISNIGAQIKSLKDANGKEYMWSGDPAFWPKTAPIMFPICGGLREDSYSYGGKEYHLDKHGFVLTREFACESHTESALTLVTEATPDTLAVYPFVFEFRVRFVLDGKSLTVNYITDNKDTKTMYYSTGAHEAYACPEGIEEYDVIFDKAESLRRTVLDGNLLEHKTEPVETDGNVLHMKYSHMDNDCLNFVTLESRGASLVKRATGKGIRVEFDDFEHFVLWTKKGAPYLCLEPWNGIPDRVDADRVLEHKEGILSLEPGCRQCFTHRILPIL